MPISVRTGSSLTAANTVVGRSGPIRAKRVSCALYTLRRITPSQAGFSGSSPMLPASSTYICDNGVAVVGGHEVLHLRRPSGREPVAPPMKCSATLWLLRVARLAIALGHCDTISVRAIGGAVAVHLELMIEEQWLNSQRGHRLRVSCKRRGRRGRSRGRGSMELGSEQTQRAGPGKYFRCQQSCR